MIRVVVVGLDLEGLIAAWVFRQYPALDVWLVGHAPDRQRSPVLVHTASMGNLLKALNVESSSFIPRDGMLLHGQVVQYPEVLKELPRVQRKRLLADYLAKAGRPPRRPIGGLKQRAPRRLRCDLDDLVQALLDPAHVLAGEDWRLEPGVAVVDGKTLEYDFAVVTAPLWSASSRVWFRIPRCQPRTTTCAVVEPRNATPLCPWDRVFTPYTPDGAVFRFSEVGASYVAEASAEAEPSALLSDLNFLFPEGYALQEIHEQLSIGPPLLFRPRWPENVTPLGSWAEWKEMPLATVIDRAYGLLRRWLR